MMRWIVMAGCLAALAGSAPAQHRGGGFSGGARIGAGHGGGFSGGFSHGGGFAGGWGHGYAGGRGWGWGRWGGWGYGYPAFGFSYGGWGYPAWGYAGWGYSGWDGPAYTGMYVAQPAVTVVYPPPAEPTQVVTRYYSAPPERARPVLEEYDEYGNARPVASAIPQAQSGPAASPIYLIAFQDHTIRAASSYRVEGTTLHYETLEHESRTAPLNSVDRALSVQLNRERHVVFRLP